MTKHKTFSPPITNGSCSTNPIVIEVLRGDLVESRHQVSAVAVDTSGHTVFCRGNPDQLIYPRSAVKPLQVLSLIETGAADAFRVTNEEIALASASHSGEPGHTEVAYRWLSRIECTIADLLCGAHMPLSDDARAALLRQGKMLNSAHNNCSGKHIAMLTTARYLDEKIEDYVLPNHTIQVRIREIIADLAGVSDTHMPIAIDGCSVPTMALPLDRLARAMAAFAEPENLLPGRASAIRRVQTAMISFPWLVAGTGRYCSEIIAATDGGVLVKTGAEGVMVSMVPRLGVGIALKAEDGARRASEVAMTKILLDLGVLSKFARERLKKYLEGLVMNWNGSRTGVIRVAQETGEEGTAQ